MSGRATRSQQGRQNSSSADNNNNNTNNNNQAENANLSESNDSNANFQPEPSLVVRVGSVEEKLSRVNDLLQQNINRTTMLEVEVKSIRSDVNEMKKFMKEMRDMMKSQQPKLSSLTATTNNQDASEELKETGENRQPKVETTSMPVLESPTKPTTITMETNNSSGTTAAINSNNNNSSTINGSNRYNQQPQSNSETSETSGTNNNNIPALIDTKSPCPIIDIKYSCNANADNFHTWKNLIAIKLSASPIHSMVVENEPVESWKRYLATNTKYINLRAMDILQEHYLGAHAAVFSALLQCLPYAIQVEISSQMRNDKSQNLSEILGFSTKRNGWFMSANGLMKSLESRFSASTAFRYMDLNGVLEGMKYHIQEDPLSFIGKVENHWSTMQLLCGDAFTMPNESTKAVILLSKLPNELESIRQILLSEGNGALTVDKIKRTLKQWWESKTPMRRNQSRMPNRMGQIQSVNAIRSDQRNQPQRRYYDQRNRPSGGYHRGNNSDTRNYTNSRNNNHQSNEGEEDHLVLVNGTSEARELNGNYDYQYDNNNNQYYAEGQTNYQNNYQNESNNGNDNDNQHYNINSNIVGQYETENGEYYENEDSQWTQDDGFSSTLLCNLNESFPKDGDDWNNNNSNNNNNVSQHVIATNTESNNMISDDVSWDNNSHYVIADTGSPFHLTGRRDLLEGLEKTPNTVRFDTVSGKGESNHIGNMPLSRHITLKNVRYCSKSPYSLMGIAPIVDAHYTAVFTKGAFYIIHNNRVDTDMYKHAKMKGLRKGGHWVYAIPKSSAQLKSSFTALSNNTNINKRISPDERMREKNKKEYERNVRRIKRQHQLDDDDNNNNNRNANNANAINQRQAGGSAEVKVNNPPPNNSSSSSSSSSNVANRVNLNQSQPIPAIQPKPPRIPRKSARLSAGASINSSQPISLVIPTSETVTDLNQPESGEDKLVGHINYERSTLNNDYIEQELEEADEQDKVCLTSTTGRALEWHRRLGHVNVNRLTELNQRLQL